MSMLSAHDQSVLSMLSVSSGISLHYVSSTLLCFEHVELKFSIVLILPHYIHTYMHSKLSKFLVFCIELNSTPPNALQNAGVQISTTVPPFAVG